MNQATQQAIPSGTDVAALRQLIMGFRSSQMIYVAAKLELADRLDQCPRTAADLAAEVGAPSPVMEATDEMQTYFYIHTFAVGKDGHLKLLRPQRINVAGKPSVEG